MKNTRPQFYMQSHINLIKDSVNRLFEENRQQSPYSLSDCFMSAYAMFHLKYPSLLQFDNERKDARISFTSKFKKSLSCKKCSQRHRERLDDIPYEPINEILNELIQKLQRSDVLKDWNVLDGHKFLSLDGTYFFSSNEVHCHNCCTRILNKGTDNEKTIYSHQMLVGSFTSPFHKQVLPAAFEPISNNDGALKNDCELNAAKRWVAKYRKLYPNMPTVIVADGLYSKAPFIKLLQGNRLKFLLVAKDADHKYIIFWAQMMFPLLKKQAQTKKT